MTHPHLATAMWTRVFSRDERHNRFSLPSLLFKVAVPAAREHVITEVNEATIKVTGVPAKRSSGLISRTISLTPSQFDVVTRS
jgi:hypothetical protein